LCVICSYCVILYDSKKRSKKLADRMVVYNNLAGLSVSFSLSCCVLGSFILLMLYMLCPVQWVVGTISSGVKLPECMVDQSSYSSAEVKNGESCYLHFLSMPSWCAQGQLYLLLVMQL